MTGDFTKRVLSPTCRTIVNIPSVSIPVDNPNTQRIARTLPAMADINPTPGQLNWRLSAHPITLLTFLSFRIGTPIPPSLLLLFLSLCKLTKERNLPSTPPTASLLVYLLGMLFTSNFVMIFIITIILLAMDFYYLKNIAGRRLVGLRWWNEVNGQSGDSHWVFESAPQANEPGGKIVNATDKRFFWLALYAQPALWVALAVVALVKFMFVWLTLVGEFAAWW